MDVDKDKSFSTTDLEELEKADDVSQTMRPYMHCNGRREEGEWGVGSWPGLKDAVRYKNK